MKLILFLDDGDNFYKIFFNYLFIFFFLNYDKLIYILVYFILILLNLFLNKSLLQRNLMI